MTEKQNKFIDRLADTCRTHEEWLPVVAFGRPMLLQDKRLLVEVLYRQAKKLAAEKGDATEPEYLTRLLDQLQLKFTLE